jgi:outer membrane protein OmpA-like peptidoglycan-associated protein
VKIMTTSSRIIIASFALTIGIGTVGCASSLPPKELVTARDEYATASHGVAAQTKPAELLTAKQELDRAEALFADEGDSKRTRDVAYVAHRKTLLAESTARTAAASKETDEAGKQFGTDQAQRLDDTTARLQTAQGTLKDTQGALVRTAADLEKEKIARAEADRKAALAMADLQRIAAVKKEDRGMVITLSGGVLFATDKNEVQASAMPQLNQVGDALVKYSPDSTITVEGHSDSQGAASYNRDLSQRRADAVAAYLASRGIARDRITAHGIGMDRPVAPNTTVDGRAQNRRVEIIVTPKP